MELFNTILYWLNWSFVGVILLAFSVQIFYFLMFFLPCKEYKPAEKKHRFAILIPCRNEEVVIKDTIKSMLKQNYPKELFDVFVVAHNCTDNTAAAAREAGAIVFEYNDDDPTHKKRGYAMKHGVEMIMKNYDNYDAFIAFDADNLAHPDYISKMNDAFDSGVELARGFEDSKNLSQNAVTAGFGLYYIRDCRYNCQVRSALGISQQLYGPGMMFSMRIMKEDGGWNALSTSEDVDFTIQNLLKGRKAYYVKDAIFYEDQPSTIKEVFNRNVRMGNGLWKLFWTRGFKVLGRFFKKWDFSYLDMFLTLLFIPIAVIACIWFPTYITYSLVYNLVIANYSGIILWTIIIAAVFFGAFVIPFIVQGALAVHLERKRFKDRRIRKLILPVLLFPFSMLIYAAGITVGALSKPQWKPVKRNLTVSYEDLNFDSENCKMAEEELNAEPELLVEPKAKKEKKSSKKSK